MPSTYSVKEIFHTLQGEGANTGTPAVFVRFAGCNLWSGREDDRASAVCRFCDTDFVGTGGAGGGRFAGPDALADAVLAAWPAGVGAHRFAVCTGGEPLERLCLWIWSELAPRFPSLARVIVRRDSCGQSCTYTGASD